MIRNIKSMDDVRQVCIYNTNDKSYHIENDEDFKLKRDIGFCAIIEDNVYGVFKTEDGPIFFINDRMYYLKDIKYSFRHTHLEKKVGQFIFSIDGKTELKLVYSITTCTNYDAWSEEEDVDFFQWLTQKHKKLEDIERFYNYYTI